MHERKTNDEHTSRQPTGPPTNRPASEDGEESAADLRVLRGKQKRRETASKIDVVQGCIKTKAPPRVSRGWL